MNTTIDTAGSDDYAAIAAIRNASAPVDDSRVSADELRHWDSKLAPKYGRRRFVLRSDGRVVGCASRGRAVDLYDPRKFFVHVAVHPDQQRQGFGTALYDHLRADLLNEMAICLRGGAREDQAEALRFLERRGFVEEERDWGSILDLTTFDESRFERRAAQFREQSVRILTLPEIQTTPGWEHQLYELQRDTEGDQPLPEPYSPPPFETFWNLFNDSPGRLSSGYLVAVDGERYVGLSSLEKQDQEPTELYTEFTGIRREYRGRGIAWALKLRGIEFARAEGYKRIRTSNSSVNEAMLAINGELGFSRQPAYIGFVLHLEDPGERSVSQG